MAVVHPQLSHSMTTQGREFTPSLERLALPEAFRLSEQPLQQFAFALTAEALILPRTITRSRSRFCVWIARRNKRLAV